jgi:hypothetical protein
MQVKPPYRYVEVIWQDAAQADGGWTTPEEEAKADQDLEICITRGYLYREDGDFLRVAHTGGDGRHVNGGMKIPKGMIRAVWECEVTHARELIVSKRGVSQRRGNARRSSDAGNNEKAAGSTEGG